MADVTVSLAELGALARDILVAHDTEARVATQVADALVLAEADGQKGHGASRIPSYAAQALSGKVDGHAVPLVAEVGRSAVRFRKRRPLKPLTLGVSPKKTLLQRKNNGT